MTKEILKPADEQYSRSATPVGVPRNAPIVCAVNLGWAIANLAAAWTKLNLDSKYQTDPEYINDRARQASAANVRLVVPYVRCSMMDTLEGKTNWNQH